MANLLVDDDGRVREVESGEIVRRLRIIGCRGDIVAAAVNKLGFVHVRTKPGVCALTLLPRLVSRLAMIGALDFIFRNRPDRVFVQAMGSAPCELFTDINRAIHRIEELAERNPINPLYLSRPLLLDGLSRTAQGRVEPLLRLWNDVGSRWRSEHQTALSEMGLLDHTRICHTDRGKQNFVIRGWGRKLNVAGSDWARLAIGRSLHAYPIPIIAKHVVPAHREAAAEGRPCAAEVHLVVADGKDTIFRLSYDRLLLPWQHRSRGTVVTGIYLKRRTQVLSGAAGS